MASEEIKQAIRLLRENGYTVTAPSLDDSLFEEFWNLYDKKNDRKKCLQKWKRLAKTDQKDIIAYVPKYVASTPDKHYRKDPATFLNNRSWENEIIPSSPEPKKEKVNFDKLIAENQPVNNEDKRHAKRQRIFGMIKTLEENPKSFVRDVLVGMYENGLLSELNISWRP